MTRELLLGAVALATVAGCGSSDDLAKLVVSGMVTFRGEPIEDGEIRFLPTGDTRGPMSAAPIRAGHYEVATRGGVPLGTHRVEIRAFRPKQGAEPLGDLPGVEPGELPKEQYLPDKYNKKSELNVTIGSGDASSQDFNLAG